MDRADQLIGIERVHVLGTAHADTLRGDSRGNWLQGGGGDDVLTGGSGPDSFVYDLQLSASANAHGVDLITDLQAGDEIRLVDPSGGFSIKATSSGRAPSTLGRGELDLAVPVDTGSGYVTDLYLGVDTVPGADLHVRLQGKVAIEDFGIAGVSSSGVVMRYEAGTEFLGSSSRDSFSGFRGDDTLRGLDGNDALTGGSGNDVLDAGPGDDYLDGGRGTDSIDAGEGDDYLALADFDIETGTPFGNNTLDGGPGRDQASYGFWSSKVGVTFSIPEVGVHADGADMLLNIERISVSGSPYGDRLSGNGLDNDIIGSQGSDTLAGGGGVDTFHLSAGYREQPGRDLITDLESAETLVFSIPSLELVGSGDGSGLGQGQVAIGAFDRLTGMTPVYVGTDSVPGADQVVDLVGRFSSADFRVRAVDVMLISTQGTTWSSRYELTYLPDGGGTKGADTLEGSVSPDLINGRGGHDSLSGQGGADTLAGGSGDDSLDGGAGRDTADYASANGGVAADLAAGRVSKDGQGGVDALSSIEDLSGSEHADTLSAGQAGSMLDGRSGSDSISGGEGGDSISGGAGDDTLLGGSGVDLVSYAGATTGATVELWAGMAANDGQGGADSLHGLENVEGSDFGDLLAGTAGDNSIDGSLGDDTLFGGAGADTLFGSAGSDSLHGGAGSDTFILTFPMVYALLPTLDEIVDFQAGAGGDRLDLNHVTRGLLRYDGGDFFASGHVRLLKWGGDTLVQVDPRETPSMGFATMVTLKGISPESLVAENIVGGYTPVLARLNQSFTGDAASNKLEGDAFADTLLGHGGNDTLAGRAGDDVLDGGQHVDTVTYFGVPEPVIAELWAHGASSDGYGGTDRLLSIENLQGSLLGDLLAGDVGANLLDGYGGDDSLYGGAGDDTLVGHYGSDFIDGGAGIDTAIYSGVSEGVMVELWAQRAERDGWGGSDTVAGVENLVGSSYNDLLAGDTGANLIEGGWGYDSLYGGAGNDTLSGDGGGDFLDAGAGIDTLSYEAAPAGVRVELWTQRAGNDGYGHVDTVAGVEHVIGSGFADLLAGTAGDDSLEGGGGADALYGGAGADSLGGGAGNDTLHGHAGGDVFRFGAAGGADAVTDFRSSEGDRIQLFGQEDGSGIHDGAAALAATNDVAGSAVVNLGGGHTITLLGVPKAALSAGDFSF